MPHSVPKASAESSLSSSHWIILTTIIGLALILRWPLLDGSFWLDEAAQALESVRPWYQQLQIVADFQPPLMHVLIHAALYVDHSEAWLRTVGALVPGLVGIALTYAIGERLIGKRVGVIAAVLLATNSFHIFYSQELRPYALPALWAAGSWWCLLRAAERVPSQKSASSYRQWLIYAGLTAAGLYSSYLYPFVIFGQFVFGLTQLRKQWRPLLISLVMATAVFVPWLPTFRAQLQAGQLLRTTLPGWSEVVSTPQFKALPLVGLKFVFGVLDLELNTAYLVAIGGVAVVTGFSIWLLSKQWATLKKAAQSRFRTHLWALMCWSVIPILASWAVSFWIPVLQPKRVLFALPAFYLLVGVTTTHLLNGTPAQTKRWSLALPGLLLLINVVSTFFYFTQPKLQRENWQIVHHIITQRYPAKTAIALFAFDAPFAPWQWYDDGSYPTLSVLPNTLATDQALAEKLKHITDYQYVMLFDYLTDLTDPHHRLETQLTQFGYQPVEVIDQPNIGFVRIYSQPRARLTDRGVSD